MGFCLKEEVFHTNETALTKSIKNLDKCRNHRKIMNQNKKLYYLRYSNYRSHFECNFHVSADVTYNLLHIYLLKLRVHFCWTLGSARDFEWNSLLN